MRIYLALALLVATLVGSGIAVQSPRLHVLHELLRRQLLDTVLLT